ncbi:MAG TPA: HesB/YadR/YfhF-family protein [Solirubrobacterales bacterium]|nr:HesB/YadR/YfhF-family protein [Solirubrobacterales bacterium]
MLELSSQAEEAIRGILASEGVPDGASFRISAQQSAEAEGGLAVSIVDEAPPEDQVVEGDDVEVRLEPTAAEMLDDKQLDAQVANGEVQFSLNAQAA